MSHKIQAITFDAAGTLFRLAEPVGRTYAHFGRKFGVEAAQCLTIEAGNGTPMVRELRSFGFPVQVVDVRRSSKFLAIRRQKRDVHDARGLAELGRFARSMGSQVS